MAKGKYDVKSVEITKVDVPDDHAALQEALVIRTIPVSEKHMESTVLVIGELEDQCFQALLIAQGIQKSTLGYDTGMYYTTILNPPKHILTVEIITNESTGLAAASGVATMAMHMSQAQRIQLQEFLVQIWE